MKALVKIILMILFLTWLYLGVSAQTIFKADLYTRSVFSDTTICSKMAVVWGVKEDTICFYLDEVRCYVSLDRSFTDPQFGLRVQVSDWRDYKYMISYLRREDGFIIWISNLERGYPSFVLSTNNICKQ